MTMILVIIFGIAGYLIYHNRSKEPTGVPIVTQPINKNELSNNNSTNWPCLPSGIDPDKNSAGTGSVAQELIRIKAQCTPSGKLVGASEKEIYFYSDPHCGQGIAPPSPDSEEGKREHDKIVALNKQYIVIQLGCWPIGYQGPYPP